ncbi:hypothetical protein V5799_027478 [Amblyomma americanum]|uniref:Uncharacterized protein n=1 Tax=Amblyomma americanum TaxID=6943 RepID=A0AAQ4DFL6_AMBAM
MPDGAVQAPLTAAVASPTHPADLRPTAHPPLPRPARPPRLLLLRARTPARKSSKLQPAPLQSALPIQLHPG